MKYEHTQIGHLTIAVLFFVMILFAIIIPLADYQTGIMIFVGVILAILASFTALTVTVDKNKVHLKFGYGIFSKAFYLKEIKSAKTVKNHWYFGWGIRLWLWPYMWIFNVSGFDAVEIRTKDKRIYRIGTDEPKELEKAIKEKINSSH